MKALREYWTGVREQWNACGKAKALGWLVALAVLVMLAMFAALAHAINNP